MTVKQIEEKADLFLIQDNKMLDKYMDDILGDLKLTCKQAYGLLGLFKICYSMGMIEMQKIKDKEYDERIAELESQIEKMQETLKSDLIARLKEDISYSTSPSCTKGMELFIKSIERWEIKENESC